MNKKYKKTKNEQKTQNTNKKQKQTANVGTTIHQQHKRQHQQQHQQPQQQHIIRCNFGFSSWSHVSLAN